MEGEKKQLLEEARALGMSLARLRSLPVSEIRKRVAARKARHTVPGNVGPKGQ